MSEIKKYKLYDVPRESYIKIVDSEVKTPPAAKNDFEKNEILFFDHVDGMYSYVLDKDNNVVHLAAWTEVEIATKEEFESQSINNS